MSRILAGFITLVIRGGRSSLATWLGDSVVVVAIGLLCLFAVVPSASAHGDDESQEGYLLVQQALGHMAHDSGPGGIELAMEKVDDALAAEDQDGVAVDRVEQARQALEDGRVKQARALLQGSIEEALSMQAPAVGEQTGTKLVLPALPGRKDLTGRDWGFLTISLIVLVAGVGLAFRFRPRDTVGELRRRLDASPTVLDDADPASQAEREH